MELLFVALTKDKVRETQICKECDERDFCSLRFLVWNLTHRSCQASAKAFSAGLSIEEPINVLIVVEKKHQQETPQLQTLMWWQGSSCGVEVRNPGFSPHSVHTSGGELSSMMFAEMSSSLRGLVKDQQWLIADRWMGNQIMNLAFKGSVSLRYRTR